jgi:hypothetical protein
MNTMKQADAAVRALAADEIDAVTGAGSKRRGTRDPKPCRRAARGGSVMAGRYFASAMQAKATLASVGTPKRAVWRAGRPFGKCLTYSALQAA